MTDLNAVASLWRDVEKAVREGKEAAISEGTTVLYQGTLDELASGSPGQGRSYRRGRRFHRASRPGSAPARDNGDLIRSIGSEINRGPNPTGIVGVKAPGASYGKYLDPVAGEREPAIGRRPFLSSAAQKKEREIQETMERELERRLRRIFR